MNYPKSLVIIPTYNEKDNISLIIPAALAQDPCLEVLIVDDGSPDGTGDIVEKMAAENAKVHLLRRPGKMGLGSAYVAGFRWALERDFERVFEMDADFSHNPEDLPRFLAAAEEADLVLGSRYNEKKLGVVNWDWKRLLLSYFANLYTRIVTGLPVKDATGGFKCFRRSALESLDLSGMKSDGYCFQIETTFKIWKKGLRVKEIPIVFTDRIRGVSKMSGGIISEAFFLVLKLRFKRS
ncbi:dolichol-phosphate mannosyltransferase [Fibrobacter intestinalis]|uniref:Dolichol-phosphate mannosyltransferase n=1 Tax=Fibrobacter intestinalis TaxID=28122 RepID=A0A1M6X7W4_9BACT|nr:MULTISPECIES: polyprenol monophosphomannose synthase [Fibrobacter]PBC66826.1 dolichol-phosphate mannosyltransferase [Fibrobacter sp. UWS1]PBC75223.1 dolichol-phosphate mannosyltransferase [Fibrobacter sp. NR9]SHL02090.1 dolichol-phosphate mannosyltransferase [Fibrobacter intestinalis]SKA11587.1 dolichol-phosphate mannosyltransferase [Fibrobacter intestinalis]